MFLYLNLIHVAVDYSTYYKYGDKGVLEVVDYLKNKNISASQIASYPHIGSYMGMADYYEINAIYRSPDKFTETIVENKEVTHIIIWERDIGRIGENMQHFNLETKIGTYYIYRKG